MAQVEPPALAGRRIRLSHFEEFIEANRKQLEATVLIARYSIETGITVRTLNDYLKVFYEAKLYHQPNWYSDKKLLTPKEYEKAKRIRDAEAKAREKERMKALESEFY